jgi:hypothetical protein
MFMIASATPFGLGSKLSALSFSIVFMNSPSHLPQYFIGQATQCPFVAELYASYAIDEQSDPIPGLEFRTEATPRFS